MTESLPRLHCARRLLPDLSADPESPLWLAAEKGFLGLVQSGAPPRQKTRIGAAWDERELRVLFVVEDTHVWATLTERDAPLYTEEVVEIFLDPVGDRESYFEIELNPLNTVLDLVLRRNRSGYKKDFGWQCEGLRSVVRRSPEGWSAELAIPFLSLTAAGPTPGTPWRVNFARIDRPPNVERELSAWSATGLANFHVPERFGTLLFTAQE